MEKGKLLCVTLLQLLYLSCVGIALDCTNHIKYFDVVIASLTRTQKCWLITVPEDSYVRLAITEMNLNGLSCSNTYIKIEVAATGEELKFCHGDTYKKPIVALNDVTITFVHGHQQHRGSLKLNYTIENLICAHKNHYRCSIHSCIHQHQVCDGVKDCENGADEDGCETGVAAVNGVNVSLENAVLWLRKQQSISSGWGRNTHRAIVALYLAENTSFDGENISFHEDIVKEELLAKQLELQTSVALLRNSSDPLSVSDLSTFINALTVTCHNPRLFYGYDLLQILNERVIASKSLIPGAYLTLCNANYTFSEFYIRTLLKVLYKRSEYPFHSDIEAMTVMALTCMKNKANGFYDITNATEVYNATIENFIANQLPDGSFGNVYTTALVTQSLLSSGQENNKLWKLNATIKFLMQELNSSTDFLSAYLVLPIFNSKSLVDITNVNCPNLRKHGEDGEISDVLNKLGGKMRIQYTLKIGDQEDVIHTMYLRMPEHSTVYDVMRVAQVTDPKYTFLHRYVSGHMYVYEIAGTTNDPEAGKFWLFYIGSFKKLEEPSTLRHLTKSPDKILIHDGEHLIMRYKTAHIGYE